MRTVECGPRFSPRLSAGPPEPDPAMGHRPGLDPPGIGDQSQDPSLPRPARTPNHRGKIDRDLGDERTARVVADDPRGEDGSSSGPFPCSDSRSRTILRSSGPISVMRRRRDGCTISKANADARVAFRGDGDPGSRPTSRSSRGVGDLGAGGHRLSRVSALCRTGIPSLDQGCSSWSRWRLMCRRPG